MMDRRQLDALNLRSLPQNRKVFPFQNRLSSGFAVFVGPSAPRPSVTTQKAEHPAGGGHRPHPPRSLVLPQRARGCSKALQRKRHIPTVL